MPLDFLASQLGQGGIKPPTNYAPPPAATGGAAGAAPTAPAPPPNPLDSDPGVALAKLNYERGTKDLTSLLSGGASRAIIGLGDPNMALDPKYGVDQQARDFAAQNTASGNSALARIGHAKDIAGRNIINRLASHGILNSGDTGYLTGENNLYYGNQEYDARQGVLDKLAELWQNYLGNKQGLTDSVVNAGIDAYKNAASNPDTLAGSQFTNLFAPVNSVGPAIMPKPGAGSIASAFKKLVAAPVKKSSSPALPWLNQRHF